MPASSSRQRLPGGDPLPLVFKRANGLQRDEAIIPVRPHDRRTLAVYSGKSANRPRRDRDVGAHVGYDDDVAPHVTTENSALVDVGGAHVSNPFAHQRGYTEDHENSEGIRSL